MPSLDPVPADVIARRARVGRRIRAARLDADLTQERLGSMVDMSRGTIGNIEHGNYSPRLDSLLMIADAVRVPLSYLVRD